MAKAAIQVASEMTSRNRPRQSPISMDRAMMVMIR
jgi:hypothetical protein